VKNVPTGRDFQDRMRLLPGLCFVHHQRSLQQSSDPVAELIKGHFSTPGVESKPHLLEKSGYGSVDIHHTGWSRNLSHQVFGRCIFSVSYHHGHRQRGVRWPE